MLALPIRVKKFRFREDFRTKNYLRGPRGGYFGGGAGLRLTSGAEIFSFFTSVTNELGAAFELSTGTSTALVAIKTAERDNAIEFRPLLFVLLMREH